MTSPYTFPVDETIDADPMSYIHTLSLPVKRRLNALRNLELERDRIQRQFNRDVMELEKKYLEKFSPLVQKRKDIVTGTIEPTDEECTVPTYVNDLTKTCECDEESHKNKTKNDENSADIGIPGFWTTCLANNMDIAELITPNDQPALQALIDIRVSYPEDQPGFRLEFVFAPNEYFHNEVLTKTYYLKEPEDGDGEEFIFERSEGTTIQWKEGKDLSVTTDVRKQRNKNTSQTRLVKRTIPADTFFNFFKPMTIPEDAELTPQDAAKLDQAMSLDYQIGEEIKENILSHPLLWFTGEANAMEGYDDEEEDYDEESEDDEDYD